MLHCTCSCWASFDTLMSFSTFSIVGSKNWINQLSQNILTHNWRNIAGFKLKWAAWQNQQNELGGCPGWSESSLGTQVILLVLTCSGSNAFFEDRVCNKKNLQWMFNADWRHPSASSMMLNSYSCDEVFNPHLKTITDFLKSPVSTGTLYGKAWV